MVDVRFEQARENHRQFGYYKAVCRNIIDWMATQYITDMNEACQIAKLCDDQIDPSGRLLGEVRERARFILSHKCGDV